ncbi:MAG: hypothetical protein GXP45_01895 [bacterium]|nr:hypothetical protein [bacterium]
MRQYGFKFSIHIMPGLYQSSIKKDIKTFQKIFADPFIKPDELKFYPTSVIPNTVLNTLFEQGKYHPLTTKQIQYIIQKVLLRYIPAYTRIKRLIRDIPATEIIAGSTITNLSQLTRKIIKKQLQSHPYQRKKLYRRLYPHARQVKDLETFYQQEQKGFLHDSSAIRTYIVGEKPNTKSIRNFASLDTRSREMRNRL